MESREAVVKVLEALCSDELHRRAWEAVCQKRWYFGNFSTSPDEPGFWKMDLDGDPAIGELWSAAKPACEKLAQRSLTVIRSYANGHTYGLGGRVHADDPRPGHYTLLYYPMLEWKPGFGGETVFHQGNGEIALSVLPKPNRGVFFDSRVPHAGRAPSRDFPGLRVTIAFKLGPDG